MIFLRFVCTPVPFTLYPPLTPGMFNTTFGELVGHTSHQVGQAVEVAPGLLEVPVQAVGPTGRPGAYVFALVQKEFGRKAGAWMTKSLRKEEQQ